MPVKYTREEHNFKTMKEFHIKIVVHGDLQSQILLGWETEELKRLLEQSSKTSNAVISELDKLLAMIEQRRAP